MCRAKWILTIVAIAVAAGCVEEKSEYTLNPDGSGKVAYERKFTPINFNMMGSGLETQNTDPQSQIKISVKEILDNSKGVDTWKDVSFELADDGRINFKGVAYFKDINKLSMHSEGLGEVMKPSMTSGKDGTIVIELKQKMGPGEDEVQGEGVTVRTKGMELGVDVNDVNGLSEKELMKKVREAKFEYNRSRTMMMGLLSNLKIERIFHLPGVIVESSNFEKTGDRSVRISMEGMTLIERMEEEMADEERLKERIMEGNTLFQNSAPDELFMNELLFGEKAAIRVVAAADSNSLFDYEAEMAEAKANYETMIKELGLEGVRSRRKFYSGGFSSEEPEIEVFEGELEMESLKIGGVRWTRGADRERNIYPFHSMKNGYSLSLIAELNGPIISFGNVEVEKAITDTGDSLVPEDDFHRMSHSGNIRGNNIAVFNVELLLPEDDVVALKEVSGTFECSTAGASKEVDLGIEEFSAGVEGSEYGAVITGIEEDEWQEGRKVIKLELNISHKLIKSVKFYDETGRELESDQRESGYYDDKTTFGFTIQGELPAKGQIVLEVYEEVKKHRVPFKITNVSLSGVLL